MTREGITGHERQRRMILRVEHADVVRLDDSHLRHAIAIHAIGGGHDQRIVESQMSHWTKDRVAVRRDPNVAPLTGQRRVFDVPGGAVQCAVVAAFEDRRRQLD